MEQDDFLCDNGVLLNIIFLAISCIILILPGWKQRVHAGHMAIFLVVSKKIIRWLAEFQVQG